MNTHRKAIGFLAGTMALLALGGTTQAETLYTSRAAFLATLTASITDGYDSPPYPPAFTILDNATMSAVVGETIYETTGFSNHNILTAGGYCAGCNGSFRLIFTATSIGTPAGVQAVGVDILGNAGLPYHAFVTYEDASTLDVALPPRSSFFGITSSLRIQSIHFGFANGASTTGGGFQIDNLTIGAISTDVTPPTVACAVTRSVLSSVTRGLLNVGLAVQAADDLGGPLAIDVSVYSDEDVGAAPYAPDSSWDGSALRLRAERQVGGAANGRVYLIVVRATDASGNSAQACCAVVCPLRLTAVDLLAAFAEATAARATCIATGLPPAGYLPQ